MQVVSNPSRGVGRSSSEYERSFTAVDSMFDDYYEKLKFRLNKRNSEYSHQPLDWDSGDEAEFAIPSTPERHSEKSSADEPVTNFEANGTKHLTPVDAYNERPSMEDFCDNAAVDMTCTLKSSLPETHKSYSLMKKNSSTQTARFLRSHASLEKKAFVPYGHGSSDQKRTFNVKAAVDVHPSAIRAQSFRKDRLQPRLCVSTIPSNRSHEKTRSKDNSTTSTRITGTAIGDLPGLSVKPIVERTDSGVQSNRIPVRTSMPSCRSHEDFALGDGWTSEYNHQYPVYPSSVYARSAALAAGRCRISSTRLDRRSSTDRVQSLLPDHPVLLSSRGSRTSNLRDEHGKFSTKHYGLNPVVRSNGESGPEILSARY